MKINDDEDILLHGPANDLLDSSEVCFVVDGRPRLYERPRDCKTNHVETHCAYLGKVVVRVPSCGLIILAVTGLDAANWRLVVIARRMRREFGGHLASYAAGSYMRPANAAPLLDADIHAAQDTLAAVFVDESSWAAV